MAGQTPYQTTRRPGLSFAETAVAADSAGDNWVNTGNETVFVQNGGDSPVTVTQHWGILGVVDGVAPTNQTVTVAAGDIVEMGPFPQTEYNNADGFCLLTYSSVTKVKILVRLTGK